MGGMREGQGDGRLIVMNNDFINTRLGTGSSEANKQKNIKNINNWTISYNFEVYYFIKISVK